MASQVSILNSADFDAYLKEQSRLHRRKQAVAILVGESRKTIGRIGLNITGVTFAEDGTATGFVIKKWVEGGIIHEVRLTFRAGAQKGRPVDDDSVYDLMGVDQRFVVKGLIKSGLDGHPVLFTKEDVPTSPTTFDILVGKGQFDSETLYAWLETKFQQPQSHPV